MSDKKSTEEWMGDWQALQKQYWNAWSDVTRQNVGQAPPTATPWHEGLEQWARMFGNAGKQSDTAERMMSSAKGYVSLMQSMLAAATGQGDASGPMQAWSDALRGGFNMPGLDPALLNNPMAAMLKGIGGDGARGFNELSQSFAPFLAQARQEGMSWLQAPAFGYAREHQEHYQKSFAAFVEYQEAMKRYNELMLQSSRRSFEIFESKLAERAEPGRQIDSLRGLYDVWVDAAEEAYAEVALSDEFRKAYGEVVNSQMRVRAQVQAEVERVGVDLGMPTRTELNSVHKRLHDLRREFRAAGSASAAAEIEALRAEVEALKQTLLEKTAPPAVAPSRFEPKASVSNRPEPKRVEPKRVELKRVDAKPVEAKRPEPKRPAKAIRETPRKRVAALAKPRVVSKKGVSSFSDAISAMRNTVAGAPKKAARAQVSAHGRRAVRSAKLPGSDA